MRNRGIYFFLFMLLIMGAFAAMAQNDYGFTILGIVSFLFSFVFLFELVVRLYNRNSLDQVLELFCLATLSFVTGWQFFYVHILGTGLIFIVTGVLLILIYLKRAIGSFKELKKTNLRLALVVLIFNASLILYFFSFTVTQVFPILIQPAEGLGFLLLLVFIFGALILKDLAIDGEKSSPLSHILKLKNHSVILMVLFFIFTMYAGLTKLNLLPKMYSSEFPPAYFELVQKAEDGSSLPQNGKYEYQEFKEMYDHLADRTKTIE